MRRRRPWSWGISARSALVAATVVFVALTVAGAILAAVLYRSMLSGIDSTAAARVGAVAADLEADGAVGLDPGLLGTDQRILAVQVITPDGTVVRRSPSAPDRPMVPISEIGDGLHIGMPEHESPYGQIRFSAQTVDGPGGRYTVLVGEGSQVVFATVKAVVIALAVAAPIVVLVSAAVTYMLVSRSMRSVDDIRTRVAEISTSDLTERVPVPEKRDEISALALTMNEMLARIEAGHSAQQRFVGDASHELRSPLTTIISALEVAVAHPELLNGELAKTTLIPEAHRMQALVDDLLLLARADERGLTMAHDDVDLDDLVASEVQRLCRDLSLDIKTDVAPTRIVGDAVRLSRMLRNLLDNAARHAASEVSSRSPQVRSARGAHRRRRRSRYRAAGSGTGLRSLRPARREPLAKCGRRRARPGDRAGNRCGTPGQRRDHRPSGRRYAGDGSLPLAYAPDSSR